MFVLLHLSTTQSSPTGKPRARVKPLCFMTRRCACSVGVASPYLKLSLQVLGLLLEVVEVFNKAFACVGQEGCEVMASNDYFATDPCPNVLKSYPLCFIAMTAIEAIYQHEGSAHCNRSQLRVN
ncbi:hypothetical protein L1887_20582 [Cichorium endivia]|nr:hypothetical protein L1887_20582 [Cichorium endivia]